MIFASIHRLGRCPSWIDLRYMCTTQCLTACQSSCHTRKDKSSIPGAFLGLELKIALSTSSICSLLPIGSVKLASVVSLTSCPPCRAGCGGKNVCSRRFALSRSSSCILSSAMRVLSFSIRVGSVPFLVEWLR